MYNFATEITETFKKGFSVVSVVSVAHENI